MVRRILLFYWFLSLGIINAQTYRFIYDVSFKKDSLSTEYITEKVVLDIIDNKVVKFYPVDILDKDSVRLKTNQYKYSYSKFEYKLIRERLGNKNTNYITLTPNYYSYETNDEMEWKILPDKKKIGEFSVQKATTNFGGRVWDAWFSVDIPFQEGPYKFKGLPGLILEIRDLKENYIFSFVESKILSKEFDTSYYIENLNTLSPIKIKEKQLKKLLLDYYSNPLKDFAGQAMVVRDEKGNIKELDAKDLTKIYQERIKKNNNPIEINKAIQYP